MQKQYFITYVRPGSINLGDRIVETVFGDYSDAVSRAHEIFRGLDRKTGVSVHSKRHCLYFWHYIEATGRVTERNREKYERQVYAVEYRDGAYRDAA